MRFQKTIVKTRLPTVLLALAFLLNSCASGPGSDDQGDDAGAIALSLQPGYSPISFFSLILAKGPISRSTGPIAWVDWPRSHLLKTREPDFRDGREGNGYVYLLHLRPGTYSIAEFNLRGCNELNSTARPIYPLELTVRPRRVVYIGSYVAHLIHPAHATKCDRYPAQFTVMLSDQSTRDLEILKHLSPQEPWDNISIELPYPDATNQPAVVAH